MSVRTISTLAFAVTLATTIAACGAEGPPEEKTESASLEPIRSAPPFVLQTLEGDTLSFDDFEENRVLLMNFWASWCAPCRAEIPDLIALFEEYRQQGFEVLGITVNDLPRDSRAFAAEMGIPYPLAIGTPKMLEGYVLSPWLPTTLLVVDGQIVEEWVGPRVRADFEYSIRVALGLAPPLKAVLKEGVAEAHNDGR